MKWGDTVKNQASATQRKLYPAHMPIKKSPVRHYAIA